MNNYYKLFIASTLLCSTSVIAEETSGPDFSLDLGWESKYVSEGRDNLGDGGITWAAAAMDFANFNLYAVIGNANSVDYQEVNIGIEYANVIGNNLEYAIGYQRLEFDVDGVRESDNELFASLAYSKVDWLVPSIGYTYSTEAEGSFVELSVHSNWALTDSFTVTPYLTQAFDYEYASDDYNGVNHFQLGIEAEFAINDSLALSGHVSQTIAQEGVKEDGLPDSELDQTYAGINLSWAF